MSINRTDEYIKRLIHELVKMPKELEWLEFKHNNADPTLIGERVSALANGAALCGQSHGYLIWGIEDKTHEIIGTTFSYAKAKVGNEELENWLLKLLEPKQNLHFYDATLDGKTVVVLEIPRAFSHPVSFQGQKFIRVGSYTKNLKEYPEKERKLWEVFNTTPFEREVAAQNLTGEEVLKLLDYPAYFELLNKPHPANMENILKELESSEMICKTKISNWNILNLGAILFAKELDAFKSLKRKSIRVIIYKDNDRTGGARELNYAQGYARAFENAINDINNLLPANEVISEALRKTVRMYPELAIREVIANAIIHQDFSINGAGPMVEVFKDRIEISNPGKPLIETDRLLDSPPRSRNEALASFMRHLGFCEERGSGIDKVIKEIEAYQLPAPIFETVQDNTRVILFAPKPFNRMERDDRIRACYQHACLKYVNNDFMTNASLRERFGIEAQNSAVASRVIKETLQAGKIHLYGPENARKHSKYVPDWAK